MGTVADGERAFGSRLRRHRQAAGLSQEELAERAGLSARGISDLERGVRRSPYPVTVRALAKALGLDATAQARLLAAVQLRSGVPEAPGPTASPPIPLSSFVGREREVAEIGRLLATTRLLTLTGTGGIGKTRLALQVAMELVGSYPDGVWLVELAPVVDPGLVPQAVAAVIGVREQPGALCCRPWLMRFAIGICCWYWTTASTWSGPAPSWSTRYCGPVRSCGSWPPVVSRSVYRRRRPGACHPFPCPRRSTAERSTRRRDPRPGGFSSSGRGRSGRSSP